MDERRLLYEKTVHQTKPYQMYLGMMSLLYPNNFSTGYPAVSFPWPVPTGKEIMEYIENDAFNGALRKKPSHGTVQSHWQNYGEWIDRSWDFYDILINHLPVPLSRRRKQWNTKFHPVQSQGYKLLDDVLYHCTGRENIGDYLKNLESMLWHRTGTLFIPMSRKKQMEWLLEKFGLEND